MLLSLRIFFFFACGYFLSFLYRTVNAVLAPDLVATFNLSGDQLGLLTSAYLLAFAAFQPILGILLDRFGPRRVAASLLVVAATGATVFALADGYAALIAGRALIGLGVSACLMAGLKANATWFQSARLSLINGAFMFIGALGAVVAGAPVEFALSITDWRGVLLGTAAITLLLAVALILWVPERHQSGDIPRLDELLAGLGRIFASRAFWQIAPLAMISQGAWLSTQGLWAGPWLSDVAGLDRIRVASHLSAMMAAMAVGFLLSGAIAHRLGQYGISVRQVAVSGMVVFIGVQLLIVAFPAGPALLLWIAYGLFGTAGMLTYTVLTHEFGAAMSGRANTAINLTMFVCAFAFQAGTGAIVDFFPSEEPGRYLPDGHRLAMLITIVLQILALGWFAASRILWRTSSTP